MINLPLVSVIIPSYNYANYLPRAIESVQSQTYRQFELIIVDDGSTDNTASVVDTYTANFPNLFYIYQNNSGPNAARNRGIDLAKGELIALLDADDEWLPEKLEKQVTFAIQNPKFGVIGCGFRWIADDGTVLVEAPGVQPPPRAELIRHLKMRYFNIGTASGVLIRKECFGVVGKFDEALRGSEDRDMWLRLAYKFDILNVEEILILVHIHQNNSHANFSKMLDSKLKFIKKHFVDEPLVFEKQAQSYAYLDAAREAYSASYSVKALYYSLLAICNYPFKSLPDDDKYQILIKSILPNRIISALRSK